MLLPELKVLVWTILRPEEALESLTSTQLMLKVPLAVRFHLVPGVDETRLIRSSLSMPVRVKRPLIVWVDPAVKVKVKSVASLLGSVFVRLLKVVVP